MEKENKSKTKVAYNYSIPECNELFKRGIRPIGVGVHDKTGNVYHVFIANSRYLRTLDDIRLIADFAPYSS